MSGIESLVYGARTDVGRRRKNNEDSFQVDEDLRLFVVCDGMGGHAAGEVASEIASTSLAEHVGRHRDLIEEYLCGNRSETRLRILDMLEAGANLASSKVFARAQMEPDKRGMGCTLVGALVLGSQAFIVHVGDSRLYLLREGRLEQVTEDHNAYNDLVKRQGIPLEQLAGKVKRSQMTRAIGIYEYVEPDTLMIDLAHDDRILLCSDGLSRYFEKETAPLSEILADGEPEATATSLVDAANERGGVDNVTAIVIRVVDSSPRETSRVERMERARKILERVPLFRRLDQREQLHILQILQIEKIAARASVIKEGEDGDCFYIVLKGDFQVSRSQTPLRDLKPGEHFGEMALIRNRPRSASVTALSEGELLSIQRDDFYHILRKKHRLAVKILWAFSRTLASRLEETTVTIDAIREEADELTGQFFLGQ